MTAVSHRQPDDHRPSGLLASRPVLAGGLLVFVLFVRAIGFLPAVINPDESIFALAAREVVRGHLPYLTLFDNKPVGSALILAGVFELLGQSIVTTRLVGAVSVWASAVGVFTLVERGGLGRIQALFCALSYVAFTALVGGLATLTEILLAPFTILAVVLLQRQFDERLSVGRRLVLAGAAGLACGVAILIKIVPIVPGFAAAGMVLLLIARRRVSMAQALLLGVVFALASAVPMIVAAGVYAGAGHLPEYLYSNIGFARAYAAIHPAPSMVAQRLGTMIDALWPLLGLAVVAVAASASGWVRHRTVDDLLLVAVAWLFGELVAASASLQFFPHYFLTAVAPLVVMAGYAIQAIIGWIGAASRQGQATAVLGGLVALIALERAEVDTARDITGGKDPSKPIAAAIHHASGGRAPTLFVTSYRLAALYSMTGAPLPPTRYAVPAHLLSRQSAMIPADPKVEVARVLASRPRFIVIDGGEHLPDWASALFDRTLSERYRSFYTHDGVTVYQATSPTKDRV